jgi:hypothetical protein
MRGGTHGGGEGKHDCGKDAHGLLKGSERTLLDIGFFIFLITKGVGRNHVALQWFLLFFIF